MDSFLQGLARFLMIFGVTLVVRALPAWPFEHAASIMPGSGGSRPSIIEAQRTASEVDKAIREMHSAVTDALEKRYDLADQHSQCAPGLAHTGFFV